MLLTVDGVDTFYGDFQALFDVSLEVDTGETVAVIGANGAGKSTLLKTIAGLLPTRAGSIRFDGQPIDGSRAFERVKMGISLVPEGRRIFPSLSVEENLLVGSYRRGGSQWNPGRIFELFPNLANKRERPGTAMSGGEQQALAIGRALMADPRFLLLDEVSLGLAPVVVKDLYKALPAITASGTTVVVVEQDISQALAAADRVYCFLEGRVALQGRADDISREQITAAYFGVHT